jgi:hypothetical protein
LEVSLASVVPKRKRPFGVTLTALGVLIIAVLNLLRAFQALQEWGFLAHTLFISPLYLALSGLFWGGIGGVLFWALWRGLHWAPAFARLAITAYFVYYWVEWLWAAEQGWRGSNWPFMIILTVILLVYIYWIFSRKRTREFFGVMHEQSF